MIYDVEALAIQTLFIKWLGERTTVASVNDGEIREFQQKTPKLRILAALESIKHKMSLPK